MLVSEIKVLSATDIASALDRTEQLYDVPEWGGAIKLRPISLAQRDEVAAQSKINGQIDTTKMVRMMVLAGMVDPVLTEDILKEKAFSVVDRIAKKVMELNGLDTGQEASLIADRTFRSDTGPHLSVSPRKRPR